MDSCINASNWYTDVYLDYVLYSSEVRTLLFLKQTLAQSQQFDLNKIASAFKQWFQPFACLVYDRLDYQYFLIRDHFGFEPFYYTVIDESRQLCFGTTLPDILEHIANPIQNTQLIEDTLTDICANSMEYTDETFYENVRRVTPGQIVQLQLFPPFKSRHHTYWTLTAGTPFILYPSDDEYNAHFASLLQEACFTCCQKTSCSIALEFSGGLDTSAILTTLYKLGIPAQLFMHIGEVEDERRYGEQLLKELNSNYPIHYVNAEDFDIIAVLTRCKKWFAGGAPYLFFMFAANIHQAVEQTDCKILLSGFGGDECVSSLAPFRTYGAEIGFKQLWQELHGINNDDSRMRQWLQLFKLKHPQLYYRLQRIKSYKSALARKQAPVYYKPYHSLQERESDWLTGPLSYHVRMRIEYSAIVAKNMGFLYQYPLLYPPLVEYCFRLPPEQKRRQRQNRLLMRRYLATQLSSELFNQHQKCGDILPGTMPKCQELYKNGRLNHILKDLPYKKNYDYIMENQLIADDRLFHLDLLRYMFR